MANRVYLFTANKIPTVNARGYKDVGAKALYEYPWDTTVVSQILTGARFLKQAPSILWNESTAAVSDFNEGVKLLTASLPTLMKIIVGANLPFDKSMLQKMQMILNKQKGRFILSEFSDISAVKKDNLKFIMKENNNTTKEAIKFAKEIKKAINQRDEVKKNKEFVKVLEKFKKLYNEDMGIGGFKYHG